MIRKNLRQADECRLFEDNAHQIAYYTSIYYLKNRTKARIYTFREELAK